MLLPSLVLLRWMVILLSHFVVVAKAGAIS
jgi:hypothetical protein